MDNSPEARTEDAKRPRIEGEARNWAGEGSGEEVQWASPQKIVKEDDDTDDDEDAVTTTMTTTMTMVTTTMMMRTTTTTTTTRQGWQWRGRWRWHHDNTISIIFWLDHRILLTPSTHSASRYARMLRKWFGKWIQPLIGSAIENHALYMSKRSRDFTVYRSLFILGEYSTATTRFIISQIDWIGFQNRIRQNIIICKYNVFLWSCSLSSAINPESHQPLLYNRIKACKLIAGCSLELCLATSSVASSGKCYRNEVNSIAWLYRDGLAMR